MTPTHLSMSHEGKETLRQMVEHPAFWNEYTAPKSAIASLVQQPAYKIDALALSDAYMQDFRRARAALKGDE
ncbi:hypothetical protein SJ05684_c10140 [Sinorhizobium sojae CCBAU 05684]|uniref:Uncharacterized protein n=1 Tax=Sinorhizobium sojae CCBAU 05684 TaxID=716928 RepID=A0A249P9Q5_9HYPH|nr:hypothetical protein [Sinorhizobium sojae]ASY62472.1 hypothetical protein SJ05684_c10140 [Sinorhizobium sojae CCBAU 05684]